MKCARINCNKETKKTPWGRRKFCGRECAHANFGEFEYANKP